MSPTRSSRGSSQIGECVGEAWGSLAVFECAFLPMAESIGGGQQAPTLCPPKTPCVSQPLTPSHTLSHPAQRECPTEPHPQAGRD